VSDVIVFFQARQIPKRLISAHLQFRSVTAL